MNTTTAAAQANVTVATIRNWCRRGVVSAIKTAGRWIIDAASLAYRITLGAAPMEIKPITRGQFEAAAVNLGIRHPFKDARCLAEYRAYQAGGEYYIDDEYNHLMVARGKALADEGYVPPTRTTAPAGTGFVHREMQALTGLASTGGTECHYCGLDSRTCDCN